MGMSVLCFADCGKRAMESNTLCFACSTANTKREIASFRLFREEWIEELEIKRALCVDGGWYPWTPQSCRAWFLKQWPDYTPKKEFEQIIYELQTELGLVPTVPLHRNLCPCTTEQGKAVNAKFEELAHC